MSECNKIVINGITIDVRSNKSLYITIKDRIFYIEHSEAAPEFMDVWREGS